MSSRFVEKKMTIRHFFWLLAVMFVISGCATTASVPQAPHGPAATQHVACGPFTEAEIEAALKKPRPDLGSFEVRTKTHHGDIVGDAKVIARRTCPPLK